MGKEQEERRTWEKGLSGTRVLWWLLAAPCPRGRGEVAEAEPLAAYRAFRVDRGVDKSGACLRFAAARVPNDKHRVAHVEQLLELHDLQHEAVFRLQLELHDALLDDLGRCAQEGVLGTGCKGRAVFPGGGASWETL